ncbi:hypothetical protein ACLB2K_025583 [Fragaria x ananassa]
MHVAPLYSRGSASKRGTTRVCLTLPLNNPIRYEWRIKVSPEDVLLVKYKYERLLGRCPRAAYDEVMQPPSMTAPHAPAPMVFRACFNSTFFHVTSLLSFLCKREVVCADWGSSGFPSPMKFAGVQRSREEEDSDQESGSWPAKTLYGVKKWTSRRSGVLKHEGEARWLRVGDFTKKQEEEYACTWRFPFQLKPEDVGFVVDVDGALGILKKSPRKKGRPCSSRNKKRCLEVPSNSMASSSGLSEQKASHEACEE